MITPQEYIDNPQAGNVCMFHALDVLDYCLNNDRNNPKTKWGAPIDDGSETRHWDFLKKHLENPALPDVDDFLEIQDRVMAPKPKTAIVDSDSGEVNIDRYLSGERLCFDEPVKIPQEASSMSILIDMAIPYCERDSPDMAPRHREAYQLALAAEASRIPCRVIAAVGSDNIPELKGKMLRLYCVIKDYQDPIFPGIWGAFESNLTTNTFLNVVMDYLFGTRSYGNGTPVMMNVDPDIDDDVIMLITPKRLKTNKK